MLRFYYNPKYIYTNRLIIDISKDTNFIEKDYENVDTPDTINGHIIYELAPAEKIPTYIVEEYQAENESALTNRQWYVSGVTQLRTGKFQISMLRDIASESNIWQNEEAYISRGYTNDNALKYNRHKFNLNMIKTSQKTLTNDLSLVMYFNHAQDNNAPVPLDISAFVSAGIDPSLIVGTYNSATNPFPFKGGDWQTGYKAIMENARFNFNFALGSYNNSSPNCRWGLISANSATSQSTTTTGSRTIQGVTISHTDFMNTLEYSNAELMIRVQDNQTFTNNEITDTIKRIKEHPTIKNIIAQHTAYRDDFRAFNGKWVQIDGQIYKVNVTEKWVRNFARTGGLFNANNSNSLINTSAMADICRQSFNDATGRVLTQQYDIRVSGGTAFYYDYLEVKVDLMAETPQQYLQGTIATNHPFMKQVPCKAIVINGLTRDTYRQWVNWAVVVMQQQPSVIETQLVPFRIEGEASVPNIKLGGIANTNIRILTERDHYYTLPLDYTLTTEFIEKEARLVRLSSGSFASSMDITPYLNNGLKVMHTRVSVKPLGTVIYMQPDFAGLYGTNFDDKRGFTIQEDFSISRLSSAWEQFKYENQNYMNTFNRQMQSLELNNYYMREADRLALDRADTEARKLARENTASEWGMFNSLLLGVPSLIGGSTHESNRQYKEAVALDVQMNEALRKDNVQLQYQLFNNNMGNIKAVAPTLNRVDTFDILNHFGIILEVFECSGAEKEYIHNYYEHNGAVIGTIGRFNQFWGLVIAGRIIRSENYTQFELRELNSRLEGGLYTGITVDMILNGGV